MSAQTPTAVAATAKRLAEPATRVLASIQRGRIAARRRAHLLIYAALFACAGHAPHAWAEEEAARLAPQGARFPVLLRTAKTSAERAGLTGPVRTVRTETAYFSNRAGPWVEGPRNLSSIAHYDTGGNQTEELRYRPGGTLSEKLIFTYDANGNRTKIVVESPDGSPSTTSHTYDARGNLIRTAFPTGGTAAYSYDEDGNQVQDAYYAADSSLLSRSVYRYDRAGNRIEATHYGSQPSRGYVSRTVFSYDAAGRLAGETSYGEGGAFTGQTASAYDTRGNKTEWSVFDHARRLKAKHTYRYEYDARGNWIVQRVTVLEALTEGTSEKPTAVIYRTITYH